MEDKVTDRGSGAETGALALVVGRGRRIQVADKFSYQLTESWSDTVEQATTAAAMRLSLETGERMKKHDIFLLHSGQPLDRSQEELTMLVDVIIKQEDLTLLIIASQRWG